MTAYSTKILVNGDRCGASCGHSCTDKVIAYGILTPGGNRVYQIHQMVVEASYQKKGLGKMIMQALINKAKTEQAQAIILEARTTAVNFYRKFGFKVVSREYPSKKTGVLHVTMLKKGIGNS